MRGMEESSALTFLPGLYSPCRPVDMVAVRGPRASSVHSDGGIQLPPGCSSSPLGKRQGPGGCNCWLMGLGCKARGSDVQRREVSFFFHFTILSVKRFSGYLKMVRSVGFCFLFSLVLEMTEAQLNLSETVFKYMLCSQM